MESNLDAYYTAVKNWRGLLLLILYDVFSDRLAPATANQALIGGQDDTEVVMHCEEARMYMQSLFGIVKRVSAKDAVETFEAKESDVIVTAFPKSGCALMQQMCYQIAVLSGGHGPDDSTGLNYSEISVVVPWIEMRNVLKTPPSAITPRVFKTHLSSATFKTLASRHIVVIRDPTHLPASLLNFLFDEVSPEAGVLSDQVRADCIDIATEVLVLKTDPSRDDGLAAWHAYTKDWVSPPRENVLVMFYEDVIANLRQSVRTVAKFMDCKLSEDDVATAAARCNREYMAGDEKFRSKFVKDGLGLRKNLRLTLPSNYCGFKQFKLHDSRLAAIEEMNLRAFGVRSYTDIRQKITQEQRDLFNR